MIPQRLEKLRGLMAQRGIDAYIVPTSDFHESEYVGDYFKARKYMSGFTGSAGTLVVTAKEACLWTDGRYFIQAANQLKDTTVTLMKMGEEGTPAIEDYLYNVVPAKGKLGFDGRVMTAALGRALIERLADKKAVLSTGEDLVGMIWEDRPALSAEPAFLLDEKYTGKSTLQKLTDLRNQMKENGCTVHIITTLDDIAWLFNIRGNDVECNPVVLSYAVMKWCFWIRRRLIMRLLLLSAEKKWRKQTLPSYPKQSKIRWNWKTSAVLILKTALLSQNSCTG